MRKKSGLRVIRRKKTRVSIHCTIRAWSGRKQISAMLRRISMHRSLPFVARRRVVSLWSTCGRRLSTISATHLPRFLNEIFLPCLFRSFSPLSLRDGDFFFYYQFAIILIFTYLSVTFMEDFWLKFLFFSFVVLWSLFVVGVFLVVVRLTLVWVDSFPLFGVVFSRV